MSAQRALPTLRVSSYTASSCIGRGRSAILEALEGARSGLKRCDFPHAAIDTYIGEVRGLEDVRLPEALSSYDCRNNRLAELALSQDGFERAVQSAARRYGAQRIGVLIGTSTSGILQTELAYRHRDRLTGALPAGFNYAHSHNSFSVTDYVRHRLELQGPATSICTACSSSAKVFAAAQRLIAAELIDAAVVGGVDSLCLTTLHGFHSLQLTAPGPCRPFDRARDGLSLAEAGAFVLLERATDTPDAAEVLLLGTGESSDAYHMSSPHPEGAGALSAMRSALAAAGLEAADIDYINLHGTGTPSNDIAEARAVRGLFGGATACSSTKGATGHALGAAGALEAVICALALEHGLMPGGLNVREPDTQLGVHYLTTNRRTPLRRVLSNSFGFGGANCALLLGRAARLEARIRGVGVLGPGLSDWPQLTAIFRGERGYESARTVLPAPSVLPAAERRRAGRVIKLALAVGAEAVAGAGTDTRTLPSIFSSSGGDGDNCHELCVTLATEQPLLSPTRFHNSVHNAAAGYWSIAYGCAAPITALCAREASFGAGLIEALAQLACGAEAVLLVAYDADDPPPLQAGRTIADAFGLALLLASSQRRAGEPRLQLELDAGAPTRLDAAPLEALRQTIPAARGLPLLERLARGESGDLWLDYLDQVALAVRLELSA